MSIYILGISAFYHDSAAVLVKDGEILAAAQEERFSRKKHDASFPSHAVSYCLREGRIALSDLEYIVFYDKPLLKFERLLETYMACAPRGLASFTASMPVWLKQKLFLRNLLAKEFASVGSCSKESLPQLLFSGHHESHAASAFFPSPFIRAGVLCLDGVGEWATTSVWLGEENRLIPQWELRFPHSLGLFFSAFTAYTGFKVNSGEYKLMGLAPYGRPVYKDVIRKKLIDIKNDGTFRLNMDYFNFAAGLTMTNRRFHDLFGGPPRRPDEELNQRHMDIARSAQDIVEEVVLRLSRTVVQELKVENLCLAGGVALNCVANGRILREGIARNLWIQPASGDAGGALGAALGCWHRHLNKPRIPQKNDSMKGALLGPRYSISDIQSALDRIGARYEILDDDILLPKAADLLADGKVVGWFDGRMEFGPRALGGRSILADSRDNRMQQLLNRKIKFRESFRPFAPSVLEERVGEWFDLDRPSPYMLITAQIAQKRRVPSGGDQTSLAGLALLTLQRSTIPAVTHVDYSARVQTVSADINPRFHELLSRFERITGCPVIVNTSFNVKDEPIVCTPEDAYRCFMRTNMDVLVLENAMLKKEDQPMDLRNELCCQGSLLIEEHNNDMQPPDRRTLGLFGLGIGAFTAGFFGLLLPLMHGGHFPLWPWLVGILMAASAFAAPRLIGIIYRGWIHIGRLLGMINARIVLSAVFFLVITPVGIARRIAGLDPLRRRLEPEAESYRIIIAARDPSPSMKDPF